MQKNKYNKIRRGFRWPPIDHCTQQPTKIMLDRLGEIGEDARLSGNAGGAVFDRSGGDQVGRGEDVN